MSFCLTNFSFDRKPRSVSANTYKSIKLAIFGLHSDKTHWNWTANTYTWFWSFAGTLCSDFSFAYRSGSWFICGWFPLFAENRIASSSHQPEQKGIRIQLQIFILKINQRRVDHKIVVHQISRFWKILKISEDFTKISPWFYKNFSYFNNFINISPSFHNNFKDLTKILKNFKYFRDSQRFKQILPKFQSFHEYLKCFEIF